MKTVSIFPVLSVSIAITAFANEPPDAAKPGKHAAEDAAAIDADARPEEARLAGEIAMLDIDAARSFHRLLLKAKEKEMEAESAKWAELKGEANQLPKNKRWPAAKKRFDEALAETVDLGT